MLLWKTIYPVVAALKFDASRGLEGEPRNVGPRRRRGAIGAMCNAEQELWQMRVQMRVMAYASQKGGSDKTRIAGHIAVRAEHAGAGPVAIIDTGPLGGLSDWCSARGRARAMATGGKIKRGESNSEARNGPSRFN